MFKNFRQTAKNILHFFLISLLFSCTQNQQEFAQSEQTEITKIDAEDHKFCITLGLDFGEDAIKNEIYWRCKIILANHKLIDSDTDPQTIRHNLMIRRYIKDLTKRFEESYEKLNDFRNTFLNDDHHKICEKQGNSMYSLKQDEVEKYMKCRQNLIKVYQINPPYKKTQYLKRPRDTYNIGFAINQRQDEELKKFNAAKEKYPFCVKLNIKSEEYKECGDAFEKQKVCHEEAKKSKFTKEMEERTICQKKLYVTLPDSLMKKDKEQEEIDRKKVATDIYNSNNFASIGIDEKMLESFRSKDPAKMDDKKKTDKKKIFNTENQLYTKTELTRLRQKFIKACNDEIEPKITEHFESLTKICRSNTLKWEE